MTAEKLRNLNELEAFIRKVKEARKSVDGHGPITIGSELFPGLINSEREKKDDTICEFYDELNHILLNFLAKKEQYLKARFEML